VIRRANHLSVHEAPSCSVDVVGGLGRDVIVRNPILLTEVLRRCWQVVRVERAAVPVSIAKKIEKQLQRFSGRPSQNSPDIDEEAREVRPGCVITADGLGDEPQVRHVAVNTICADVLLNELVQLLEKGSP